MLYDVNQTQGLLVYGLEEDMVFNPLELDEAATPAAVNRRIAAGEHAMAITMAAQVRMTLYDLCARLYVR